MKTLHVDYMEAVKHAEYLEKKEPEYEFRIRGVLRKKSHGYDWEIIPVRKVDRI